MGKKTASFPLAWTLQRRLPPTISTGCKERSSVKSGRTLPMVVHTFPLRFSQFSPALWSCCPLVSPPCDCFNRDLNNLTLIGDQSGASNAALALLALSPGVPTREFTVRSGSAKACRKPEPCRHVIAPRTIAGNWTVTGRCMSANGRRKDDRESEISLYPGARPISVNTSDKRLGPPASRRPHERSVGRISRSCGGERC